MHVEHSADICMETGEQHWTVTDVYLAGKGLSEVGMNINYAFTVNIHQYRGIHLDTYMYIFIYPTNTVGIMRNGFAVH